MFGKRSVAKSTHGAFELCALSCDIGCVTFVSARYVYVCVRDEFWLVGLCALENTLFYVLIFGVLVRIFMKETARLQSRDIVII